MTRMLKMRAEPNGPGYSYKKAVVSEELRETVKKMRIVSDRFNARIRAAEKKA
ncbi:MAG: hypothetical protein PHT33_10985 [bacterium]|nr:hypothetical protein [bacterium]